MDVKEKIKSFKEREQNLESIGKLIPLLSQV